MSKQQGVIRRATAALRRAAGMLRTIGLAALLLPALVAQAQTTSSTSLGASPNPSTFGQSVTLTATVTGDNPSGDITFKDGATTLGTGTLSAGVATLSVSSLSVGSHSLTAEYPGDTNNTASSSALSQVVNQVSSSTALSSSTNPSSYSQSITLTATVTGSSPSGSVTFKDGSTTLGTGTLSGGVATLNVATLSVGSHSLTAEYTGDTNNAASTSSALTQTVNQVSTTSAVTSGTNPSAYSTSTNVTFTATVTGNAPTGSVTFMDGAINLGSSSLGTTGGNSRTATLPVNSLAVGAHSITVVYSGDSNNASSTSSALTQTVNKASSTSVATSSLNPSTFNSNVTFTATVTGQAPTGDVTFKDGTTVLGTGTLAGTGNSRTTTLATSTLSIAAHSITVVYAGDGNNNTSTSAVLTQTVNKYTTTTALTSSANPSAYSQNVTFTATVSGAGSPTGTVTFKDGTTTLATVNLTGNVATYSLSTLSVASHGITAVYNGDATNNTSTSTAVSQVVSKYTSSTALTSSLNPGTAGQAITLTATVTGATPTGLITFKDGATTLGTATLSGGTATLNYSAWTAGAHSLSAVYAGDTNNATSTGALSQSFNPTATTLALTLSKPTASLGENVTLTAKVVGGYLPSGLVTFSSGAGALGTASVNGGAATFSINNLGVGSHTLSAVYAGDASNQGASSGSVSLTVNPRAGMTWQYGYDAMGRINTMVDPNGLATYIYYDSLGRPIQTRQPANTGSSNPTIIDYSYNLADSLTQVADPRNLATTYTPNGLGNVTSQSSPDTGATQYTYDAKGNVLTSTDSRSKTTTYTYDNLDRVLSISYPTGSATSFEYDGGTTPTPAEKGELTKMTDESGQTTYAHDALGRLSTKTTVISGKTFTTSYSWGDTGSAMDKLTAITYPSGSRVNYNYDAQGYISGVAVNPVNANGVGTSASTVTLLSALSYNAENKVTGWLWVDGKARTIAYDSNGMVAAYNLGDALGTGSAAGNLRTVTRDAAGRITGYSHTNNGTAQTSLDQGFGYDNLNRLLSASVGGSSTQYSYDETGNRTSKTIAGTTYSNTVASTSNKLTQTQDVNGTATIQYDTAGHITNDGVNSFTYSDRGRMTSATNAGGTVAYLYNGQNQRVYKSGPTALVPTGAAYFLYDEQGQLLGEYDANGAPVYETIYLGSLPVGVLKQTGTAANSDIATTVYNVHADHIATARVITQQDQAMVWRWDTAEAFGGTVPDQNPNGIGTFTYNQRFPGQVFDSETGLFQNWNREYNARQGRYIQSDPIGLAGGINTFAYVEGDPLTATDPQGLQTVLPGPGGFPLPVMPIPGMSSRPSVLGWDPFDGPAPAISTGTIVWPPGIRQDPEPMTCHIEIPSSPPPLPPKNDCESQLKVCTDIARSYPWGTKLVMMSACFVQYAICKKVFKDN
ncbi:Ig-like domain repeat protein [Polaromonas sp. YR568]|uniref:Ig-like domain repeat protein n=1 Tax=Polaromonas sp. YR568 TaxID=1855301 RepID=UPI003137724E